MIEVIITKKTPDKHNRFHQYVKADGELTNEGKMLAQFASDMIDHAIELRKKNAT